MRPQPPCRVLGKTSEAQAENGEHPREHFPPPRITNILQLQSHLVARFLQSAAFQDSNDLSPFPREENQMCEEKLVNMFVVEMLLAQVSGSPSACLRVSSLLPSEFHRGSHSVPSPEGCRSPMSCLSFPSGSSRCPQVSQISLDLNQPEEFSPRSSLSTA